MTLLADTHSPSSTAYAGHLSNGDPAKASAAYKPTHPDLFAVQFRDGQYNSCLVALRSFRKGETIAFMTQATLSRDVRYSTVQVSETDHIELNSDLLYCNHSCDPSVHFNVSCSRQEWRAEALKDIEAGDVLEFFYPSTEWNMSQPFDCSCGAKSCLRRISGAKDIPSEILAQYVVNDHIKRLKAQ